MPRKAVGNEAAATNSTQQCFVLMPFKPDLDATYENAIRPAVIANGRLSCTRADEIYGPRPIMADIWRSINAASLVLADLTGRNPNVLYELGLAHAIQKPVILLTQKNDDIPFDLRAIRCIHYQNNRSGREILRDQLERTVLEFIGDTHGDDASARLREYVILAPANAEGGSSDSSDQANEEKQQRILEGLRSNNSSAQFTALSALIDPTDTQISHHFRSNLIPLISGHLESDRPEMVLASAKCLAQFGDAQHVHLVDPLLDSGDPDMIEAALRMMVSHESNSSEGHLLELLEDLPSALWLKVVDGLAGVGGDSTVAYLSRSIREGLPSGYETKAVETLHRLAPGRIAELLDVNALATDSRRLIAERIRASDEDTGRPRIRGRAIPLVLSLAEDGDPVVRGAALASWCALSSKPSIGGLSRDEMWQRLQAASDEAIDEFVHEFNLSDEEPWFRSDEAPLLIELSESHPILTDGLVFYFHKNGGTDAAEFMLRFLETGNSDRLWAFAYFARCPSEMATENCESEMSRGEDVSTSVLAATCLAKLGDKRAADFVRRNRAKKGVHAWVKDLSALPRSSVRTKRGSRARPADGDAESA